MNEFNDPYPNIPSFTQHPNGGGKVCTRSIVDETIYIGPNVVVLRSMIYKGSHIDGFYTIEDSEISGSKIITENGKANLPSEIRKSILVYATINGQVNINSSHIITTEFEAITESITISYFHVGHSFLKGNITLQGEPSKPIHPPDSRCPKILFSHIEGDLTFNLPYTTRIHSTIIKPSDAALRATPNRNVLSKLVESLPPIEHKVKNVVWAYDADFELAQKVGLE